MKHLGRLKSLPTTTKHCDIQITAEGFWHGTIGRSVGYMTNGNLLAIVPTGECHALELTRKEYEWLHEEKKDRASSIK